MKDDKKLSSQIIDPTLFIDPKVISAMKQQTPIANLLPTHKDLIMQRTRITDIDDILNKLQERIDYEKETCSCCGIHPDDLRDY